MKKSKRRIWGKSSNKRRRSLPFVVGLGVMVGVGTLYYFLNDQKLPDQERVIHLPTPSLLESVPRASAPKPPLNGTLASKTPVLSGAIVWRTPSEGLKEAKKTHKPILYDITAEWCPPCRRLTSEVFENAEYAARINKKFIPVRVIDRRSEEGSNPPEVADLETKYFQGFPTLVIQIPGKSDFKRLVGFRGKEGTMEFLNQSLQ